MAGFAGTGEGVRHRVRSQGSRDECRLLCLRLCGRGRADHFEQTSQIAGQAQSTLQTGFGHLLREQPLALVVLGLAAGAAVATLLPATEMEERTLAPARDAIAGVTGKVGENLIEAASEAGERLTQGIAERASEGFKELVLEVGEKFTGKVAGKTENPGALATNVSSLPSRGS